MTADHALTVGGHSPDQPHKVFVLQYFAATVPLPSPGQELGEWLATTWVTPRNYASDTTWDVEDPSMKTTAVFDAVEAELDAATRWLATGLAATG